MRLSFVLSLVLIAAIGAVPRALAVQPQFDPAGAGFYAMPFPFELRRDPDGTVSLAGFPAPGLVATYVESLEQTPGFGLDSGVFVAFDGGLDPTTLPADAAATVSSGSAVFLLDVDPASPRRGQRIPLWTEFRTAGDVFRAPNLLGAMPVPGHPLAPQTLYALVITTALHGDDGQPLTAPPFIQRMQAETPSGAYESAALPLFRTLWAQLESEGLAREAVAVATIYRTYDPTREMVATERLIHRRYRQRATDVAFASDGGTFWTFTGHLRAPQFQSGVPPFSAPGSGGFVLDAAGRPVVQHDEMLEFVLTLPKETGDGSVARPPHGWPIVAYMHGTGGNRFSAVTEGLAHRLAQLGIATLGIDQPLHGLRPGATPDGTNFYNPLNPRALRDNPRQAAADSLAVHELLARLLVDRALVPPASGVYRDPARPIRFDRQRRLFMGHSQGATTGPLFLAVARDVRGAVLSAGGGHIIVNILTREQPFYAGLKLRDLVEILVGGPVDLFHPALHLLQMGSDLSDPVAYAPRFQHAPNGRPLDILFTHGLKDGYVPTPMNAAMVVAGGYPLVAPTFPPMTFPKLPGYSYQETFDLAGLPTLATPVANDLGSSHRRATGGLVHYELDGHFPVFNNPEAITQWTGFLRSLAYERTGVIPDR